MLRPKKNSYKEFDDEKKFLRLKNSPPPPHNFSNGPSLSTEYLIFSPSTVSFLENPDKLLNRPPKMSRIGRQLVGVKKT